MNEGVLIEDMTLSDLPSVMSIENSSFTTPWSRGAFLQFIKDGRAVCLAARIEGEIVGYAVGWLTLRELHIGNLAVEEHHRRQGIGSLLLKELMEKGWGKGVLHITLEVRPSNTEAISLYKKYGFVEIAFRKGYYLPEGEDALVMMKEFVPEDSKETAQRRD